MPRPCERNYLRRSDSPRREAVPIRRAEYRLGHDHASADIAWIWSGHARHVCAGAVGLAVVCALVAPCLFACGAHTSSSTGAAGSIAEEFDNIAQLQARENSTAVLATAESSRVERQIGGAELPVTVTTMKVEQCLWGPPCADTVDVQQLGDGSPMVIEDAGPLIEKGARYSSSSSRSSCRAACPRPSTSSPVCVPSGRNPTTARTCSCRRPTPAFRRQSCRATSPRLRADITRTANTVVVFRGRLWGRNPSVWPTQTLDPCLLTAMTWDGLWVVFGRPFSSAGSRSRPKGVVGRDLRSGSPAETDERPACRAGPA
jgi:hypothetical protein